MQKNCWSAKNRLIPPLKRSKKERKEVFESWADLSAIEPQAGNLTVNDTMVGKVHLFDEKDILVKLHCNFTRGFSTPGMYSQLVIYFKSKKRNLE
jgi:hypothetical protein